MNSKQWSRDQTLADSQSMFKPDKWRNIQDIVRDTFVQFDGRFLGLWERLHEIEVALARKADRDQILTRMIAGTEEERSKQFKLEDIEKTIRLEIEPTVQSLAKQQIQLARDLDEKIRRQETPKAFPKQPRKQIPIKLIPNQELQLESNQTMFALVVEELKEIREEQLNLADCLTRKSKPGQCVGHEFSEKLEALDREIAHLQLPQQPRKRQQHHQRSQAKRSKTSHQSKAGDFYDKLKLTNFSEILAELQNELHEKAYLRDIVQLVKNITTPLEESLSTLARNFESNLSSTNKILNHQSIINEQLCREARMGRWEWSGSTTCKLDSIPWEKELLNLYPQSLLWNKNTTSVLIRESGLYYCELILIGGEADAQLRLVVNNAHIQPSDRGRGFSQILTDVLRFDRNSSLSAHYSGRHGSALLSLRRL